MRFFIWEGEKERKLHLINLHGAYLSPILLLYKWNIFSSFADNMNILCCPCFSLHLLFFSFFFFSPPLNPYQEVPLQQFLTWLIQVICWLYWMLLFIYTSARRKFNTLQWIIGKETQVGINESFVCLMHGKAGDGHLNWLQAIEMPGLFTFLYQTPPKTAFLCVCMNTHIHVPPADGNMG